MILLITSIVLVINIILYKKERYDLLYIPIVIESISLFIFSFFSNINILNISWITSSSWTLVMASIICAISATITFVKKEQTIIWNYHLVLLLLLMINNKYVLSITVCVCILTELSRRIKTEHKPINTKFIVIMPLLLSITAFNENLNGLSAYVFSIVAVLILLIDFFKITVYRIFAILSFANLLYILGLNQSVFLSVMAVGPVYLLLKLYILFGKEKFDYRKVKSIERVIKKFIIERNSKERLLLPSEYPFKKRCNEKRSIERVSFENDIRQNFLLIIGSFCIVALYLLVRS